MGFIATNEGGGNFKRVPSGAFIGRCYSLIDLGTQLVNSPDGEKLKHRIQLGWELFGEDDQGSPLTVNIDGHEMPMTIKKSYTVSMHEKAGLRKDLAAWRGKDFTEDEAKAFDVSKLLGAYCMVNVTTNDKGGKTYSNVAGLTPLPGALRASKPAPVHADQKFDLDAPDMALFSTFHERLQDAIKKSPEWALIHRRKQQMGESQSPSSGFEDDGEIPF